MADEQKIDTQTIDALTVKPPAQEPPAPEKFTIDVDGQKREVTREELIAFAQKGAHADKTLSEWGRQKKTLEEKAAAIDAMTEYRQTRDPRKFAVALKAAGYDQKEIDAYIQQEETRKASPGRGQEMNQEDILALIRQEGEQIVAEQLKKLKGVVYDRENLSLRTEIEGLFDKNEYISGSLRGLPNDVRDGRREVLLGAALEAVQKAVRETGAYSPFEIRKLAEQATTAAEATAKKLGLLVPTPNMGRHGHLDGFDGIPETQPSNIKLEEATTKDVGKRLESFLTQAFASRGT